MENIFPTQAVMVAALIGMVLYYIFEFIRRKKVENFSFAVWAKDNWWKIIVLSPLCLLAWCNYINPGIDKSSAFILGLGVSTIVDQLQDMATKPKS